MDGTLQLFETGRSHMALLVRPKVSGDLRAMRRHTTLASESSEGCVYDNPGKCTPGLGTWHGDLAAAVPGIHLQMQ